MERQPDYRNSIVNLMASIAGAAGVATGHAPLAQLPPDGLGDGPLLLLVLDGLGDAFLARHPDSHLHRHRAGRLTSVFPTTTASAITSFATGCTPRRHAITGWHMWLREVGTVATILPFVARHSGRSLLESGIEPADVIGRRPLTERLPLPCEVVSPANIIDSAYNRAVGRGARRHRYRGLAAFFERLLGVTRSGRRYVYGYWSEVDYLAHRYGAGSRELERHFGELDAAFGQFLERAAGSGATVLVTADHGLLDTEPARSIDVADHPRLAATLTLPLCGEPRAAFAYVRPGRAAEFRAYVAGELGHACTLHRSGDLVEAGLFGDGASHPALQQRIGDYTLLMRENWVIRERLPNEKPFEQRGVHGGLSAEELYVPLIVARP